MCFAGSFSSVLSPLHVPGSSGFRVSSSAPKLALQFLSWLRTSTAKAEWQEEREKQKQYDFTLPSWGHRSNDYYWASDYIDKKSAVGKYTKEYEQSMKSAGCIEAYK